MVPSRVPAVAGLPPEAAEIIRLIAKGNSKSAVEAAKLLHKRLGTTASEELLVDAYIARVRSMLEHRMTAEAEALRRMARERHPAFAARLDSLRSELTGGGAGLDELVRPLADPAASADVRASIEQTLRTELTDPAALAACTALPADHPLLRAASAVARAFNAVTSGPVDDAALSLPEVSRRSPLAAWKPLVRAIASYHRHEDAACAEHVRAIDAHSAPARLVPALEALVGAGNGRTLKPAATSLAAQAGGSFEGLRHALQALDTAFQEDEPKSIYRAIRDAAPLVQQQCPEILTDFRCRVAVLGTLQDIPTGQVIAALGGAPRADGRFLLMEAQALEAAGAPLLLTCHVWEHFRHTAIKERWFPARGPEMAVLLLHMAELAGQIDPGDLAGEYQDAFRSMHLEMLEGGGAGEPVLDYLQAEPLFERAATMDPCAEVFERWIAWATGRNEPSSAQAAAEAWRTAIPTDPRPLLHLMRMAEERDALKKALGYLRQAEALDGVNSEVRRARLRLLIIGAVRHLKQRKPRLAKPELAELETLPQVRENDRSAFVASLQHIAAYLSGDEPAALAAVARVRDLLGHPLTAAFALAGVGSLCGVALGVGREKTSGTWTEAIPRVCDMGWDLGFTFFPPEHAKQAILQELGSAGSALLERLGRTVMRLGWKDLAFPISSAGLAAGKDGEGRFLLLRATAYSGANHERRENCVVAALALARLSGDTELAGDAAQRWRETSIESYWGGEPPSMTQPEVQAVLKRERTTRKLPSGRYDPLATAMDSPLGFDPPFPRPPRARRSRHPLIDNLDLPF